jgi:hypothetical protein
MFGRRPRVRYQGGVESSGVLYTHRCALHGAVALETVKAQSRPAERSCPVCGRSAEIWVGPRPASVGEQLAGRRSSPRGRTEPIPPPARDAAAPDRSG